MLKAKGESGRLLVLKNIKRIVYLISSVWKWVKKKEQKQITMFCEALWLLNFLLALMELGSK